MDQDIGAADLKPPSKFCNDQSLFASSKIRMAASKTIFLDRMKLKLMSSKSREMAGFININAPPIISPGYPHNIFKVFLILDK